MKRFIKTLEPLSGLPNGFTEVEYLESTGTQYIDTEYIITSGNSSAWEGRMMWTKSEGSANFFYGYRSVNQAEYRGDMRSFFIYGNNTSPGGRLAIRYGVNADNSTSTNVTLNKPFKMSWDGNNLKVDDDTKISLSTAYTPANYKSMWLFWCNCTGYYNADVSHYTGRIYYWKIWDDGKLVRDFIPALDPTGKPCMYDLIEGKPHYNLAASGNDFSYGKQIIPVSYLEADGTQYIDTGYIPSNTTGQYAKMQYTTINNGVTFGGMVSGNGVVGPYFATSSSNVGWWIRWGTNEPRVIASTPTTTNIYEMYLNFNNDRIARVDNIIIENSLGSISGNYPSLTLFRRNFSSGYAYLSGKIFSYKITEGTNLVRDMIPAIDENNVGYMFDKLNHTLYENKGTGSFSYGKKVYKPKLRLVEEKSSMRGLPNGFTEVEYLESKTTNDFAIDTGIVGKDGIESEVCVWFNTQVNNQCVLGSWSNASTRAWLCYTFGKKWYIGYNATNQTTMDLVPNQWNIVKMTRDASVTPGRVTLSVNNIEAGTISYTKNWNNGVNLTLFRMNNDTGGDYYGSTCRVSYCKLWDNGILVRDYIPCLDSNNVPCMYDKVEGKVYYNVGSGEFGYGKKIIPVEYLESTGTQYIDTGYIPTSTSTYKVSFELTNITTTAGAWFCVFGSVESNNSTFTELFLPRVSGDGDVNQVLAGNHNTTYLRKDYTWVKDTKYAFEMTPTNVLINGVNQGSITTNSSLTCSHSIYLFARHEYNDAVRYNVSAKIYSFKIYDNNLVRDYIPVIDENNVGYMFDKVSHTLYENKGTGAFNYGEKVYKRRLRLASEPWYTKKYDLVNYIQSAGNSYIDTGYVINTSTDEVEMDFQLTDQTLYHWIFGEHDDGKRFGVGVGDGTNKRNIAYGATTYKVNDTQVYNSKHTFKANSTGVYVDNAKVHGFETFTSISTLLLFDLNLSGAGRGAAGKMWSYKHKRNGQYIRYMLPALRKSDNKYGMLDMVTKQFFPSEGSEDFTGE